MSTAPFRRELVGGAVEVRAEVNAVLLDFPTSGETEDLIAAAVGQDRTRPAHEAVQSTATSDEVVTGPEKEVIGVAEDDGGADIFEIAQRHRLDRALRADRHEHGRVDRAMRGGQDSTPGAPIPMSESKGEGKRSSAAALLLSLS